MTDAAAELPFQIAVLIFCCKNDFMARVFLNKY